MIKSTIHPTIFTISYKKICFSQGYLEMFGEGVFSALITIEPNEHLKQKLFYQRPTDVINGFDFL